MQIKVLVPKEGRFNESSDGVSLRPVYSQSNLFKVARQIASRGSNDDRTHLLEEGRTREGRNLRTASLPMENEDSVSDYLQQQKFEVDIQNQQVINISAMTNKDKSETAMLHRVDLGAQPDLFDQGPQESKILTEQDDDEDFIISRLRAEFDAQTKSSKERMEREYRKKGDILKSIRKGQKLQLKEGDSGWSN